MNYNERYLQVEFSGVRLPAALTLPRESVPKWGIVLVPGSFNSDLDGNYTKKDGNPFEARPHTYVDLAGQLAGRDLAVLRYGRAGRTVVDPDKAAASAKFAGRAEEAAHAVQTLREAVRGLGRIALAGHSEGAAVGLLLLTTQPDVPVDAYISLSGPGRRFFDIMIEQAAPSVREEILDMMGFRIPFDSFKESFRFIREGLPVPEAIRKSMPPFSIQAMPPSTLQYLRDYDRLDPAAAIAGLTVPVLIVQGGQDLSVLPDNADRLWAARKARDLPVSRAVFPELNHFYKVVPPDTPPQMNFGLETGTDERVARAISDWLDRLP